MVMLLPGIFALRAISNRFLSFLVAELGFLIYKIKLYIFFNKSAHN
jgi:hypothetical protein